MKKIIEIFIIITILLCSGCKKENPNEPSADLTPDISAVITEEPNEPSADLTPDISAAITEEPNEPSADLTPDISAAITEEPNEPSADLTPDISAAATEGEPIWAKGIQSEAKLFQHLNLDGIGDADDEAYVSVYKFGDYKDRITVLRIHLGTGETMAKIFPIYGYYSFQTGKLFSENKEAIILDIQDPTSNYNAATVFVVDVVPVGADPFPISAVRLDTTDSPISSIYSGTQVIDIEGSSLQGLEIPSWDPRDKWAEPFKNIFQWNPTDREWLQSTK